MRTARKTEPKPAQDETWDTLVLGIGNLLLADEGFGVRCAEALHAQVQCPQDVRIMDGGTQGIFLLPWVRTAQRLLIFDAIDFGLEPATLRLITGSDVPRYMGAKKVSMHQAGFQEVLSSAALTGDLPQQIALVGVQPQTLDDYGGSLTAAVRNQVGPAITIALAILRDWGVKYRPRKNALRPEDGIGPGAMDMAGYEAGRPIVCADRS